MELKISNHRVKWESEVTNKSIVVKSKTSALYNFLKMLKGFDTFGENFSMKLDKRKSILNTSIGCHITIVAYLVILMYTVVKFDAWIAKKDIDIMATKLTDSLPGGYTFG